jgi:hypothetical protein
MLDKLHTFSLILVGAIATLLFLTVVLNTPCKAQAFYEDPSEQGLYNYVPTMGDLFGRDLTQRSLSKRIITNNGWSITEHRPAGTGVDIIHRPNCPDTPRKIASESWHEYTSRMRAIMSTWPTSCFP